MANYILNRFELSQYSMLRAHVLQLDENIREIKDELTELNKYLMNISPVLTGMPGGNEKRDKIADFIIRLDSDRQRLDAEIASLTAERDAIKYRLKKIRTAVNNIKSEQLREIVKRHYLDGQSISEVASETFLSENAIYKRLNRHFKHD